MSGVRKKNEYIQKIIKKTSVNIGEKIIKRKLQSESLGSPKQFNHATMEPIIKPRTTDIIALKKIFILLNLSYIIVTTLSESNEL